MRARVRVCVCVCAWVVVVCTRSYYSTRLPQSPSKHRKYTVPSDKCKQMWCPNTRNTIFLCLLTCIYPLSYNNSKPVYNESLMSSFMDRSYQIHHNKKKHSMPNLLIRNPIMWCSMKKIHLHNIKNAKYIHAYFVWKKITQLFICLSERQIISVKLVYTVVDIILQQV